MNPTLTQIVILLVLGALYLPVIFFAMQHRDDGHGVAIWLAAFYSALAMTLNIAEAFWHNGDRVQLFYDLQIYTSFMLAAIVMLAMQTFLKREGWRIWLGVWLLWGIVLALFITNAFDLPDVIVKIQRAQFGSLWAILGWFVFSIGLIVTLAKSIGQTRQPLLRNRLNFWWPSLFLIFINDVLLFSGTPVIGHPLRLGAVMLMTYVIGTHHIPDLKQILRRALVYALIIFTIVGLYIAGFLTLQFLIGGIKNFNPLFAGAFIALVLALIFAPVVSLISRTVTKWMKGDQYDVSRALHQYSDSISNILDMDRLSNIAVGLILETMQIERGFLFTVDSEHEADGRKTYRLHFTRSPEERKMIAAELDENGVIASYFIREQKPLLQYDLDLLPTLRLASPFERNWFTQLHAEVYIPIFAKKKWVGLLAFGSKLNGNRYTQDDLNTLSSHASQTAVALENARLVENLMRLNNELRTARRALEKNNQDLERIDRAKSDFISIASHELRTPLTIIKGYTEMLIEDPNLDPNIKLMMTGISDGTKRLHEVMDSMFDIAQIDARALKPHLQPVKLGQLIKEVCAEQADALKGRKQTITADLPTLPSVDADTNLLRKLFQHLISNAVKFTPNNGKITISGRHITQVANLPNGAVEIVVSDTGVGVDPNFHEIIFSKFYQPGDLSKHSTSKTGFKGGGAGLGLAVAKGIVEAHGGRIFVVSPGYDDINFPGSHFHVVLPLSKGEG